MMNMPNYQNAAKVLDELMIELIEKGAKIPDHVISGIRSGRSFVSITLRQPDEEVARQAMIALQNVEMNLLALAEQVGGMDYAEEWQRRVNDAYAQESVYTRSAPPQATKFVSGVPKGEYWIRIEEAELLPVQGELAKLLGDFELTSIAQEDGYLLLYGRKENVSSFLKDIRQKVRKKGDQCNN